MHEYVNEAYLPKIHHIFKREFPLEADQHPTKEEVHVTGIILG